MRCGADWSLGAPVHITFQHRLLYTPSPAQLQLLKSEVQGRPDHPERYALEAYIRRVLQPDEPAIVELWLANGELGRCAFDGVTSDGTQYFIDEAVGRDGGWLLTGESVIISSEEDSAWRTPAAMSLLGQISGPFFAFGATTSYKTPLRVVDISVLEARASVTLRGDDDLYNYAWTLEPSDECGPCIISAERTIGSGVTPPSSSIAGWRYEGHRFVDGLAVPIPSRAIAYAQDGRAEREVVVDSVQAIDKKTVEAMSRIPSASRPDQIRGWKGQAIERLPANDAATSTALPASRDELVGVKSPAGLWSTVWRSVFACSVATFIAFGLRRVLKKS